MIPEGNNWYYYKIPIVTSTNLIFNANGVNFRHLAFSNTFNNQLITNHILIIGNKLLIQRPTE